MTRIIVNKYHPNFGTHLPVLIKLLEMSKGPVLELGMGVFSTPVLHILCAKYKRLLVSYESNKYYTERHQDFITDLHKINFVRNWDEAKIEEINWGLAFVDHDPTSHRHIEAGRLANVAKFVIIHDSEPNRNCNYDEIYHLFKYRFDYKKSTPWTTVLSNFVDLTDLKI